MQKIIQTIALTLSLSACVGTNGSGQETALPAAQCFAEKFACDLRETFTTDGLRFVMCNAPIDGIDEALKAAQFTTEIDTSWNRVNNGLGAHTKAPTNAHFHLSNDSLNCFLDGQGPLHCGGPEWKTFIVMNEELSEEIVAQVLNVSLDESCLKVQ
jgi:hypothetical protein